MANPASSLPVIATQMLSDPLFKTLDPATQAIFRQWAADPFHPPAQLSQAVTTAKSKGLFPNQPMSWWEKVIAYGGPAALTGAGLLGLSAGTGSAPLASASAAPATVGTAGGTMAGATGATGADIFQIPGIAFGTGMGVAPASVAGASAGGGGVLGSVGGAAAGAAGGAAAKSVTDRLLNGAFTALAGLPALFSNRNPSQQEQALQQQAAHLLAQQEQRTQFQNPLYEAASRMAYSLLPRQGNGGNPYPYAGLSDVNVPGLDALTAAQRRQG